MCNNLLFNFEEQLKDKKFYEDFLPLIKKILKDEFRITNICHLLFYYKYSIPKELLDVVKKKEWYVKKFLFSAINNNGYFYDKGLFDIIKEDIKDSAEIEAALIKRGIEVPEQIKGSLGKIDEFERNSLLYTCLDCTHTYFCRSSKIHTRFPSELCSLKYDNEDICDSFKKEDE